MLNEGTKNAIRVLDSEVKKLKKEYPLKLKIVIGSLDKKEEVLQHLLRTTRQKKLKCTYMNLGDLTEETDVTDQDVIVVDELDHFIFQPPLGRLSLKMKLDKLFDDLGSGKLIILGVRSDEALSYFRRKFKPLYSQAEIIDIR